MNKLSPKESIESVPFIRQCVFYIRYFHVYLLVRSKTWWQYGRKYDAEIDPYRIVNINPNEVTQIDILHDSQWSCSVEDGNWDLMTEDLSDYDLYQSFIEHFEDDVPWEETSFYQRVKQNINNDEDWKKWRCTTIDDFESRLERIDQLYESIKSNGYKSQRELVETGLKDPIYFGQRSIPLSLYEVTMNVNRNGDFILHEGRHRLTIAQILDLNTIPVRICIRHEKWQKKRDAVINGTYRDIDLNHPDIEYLID